MKTISKFNDKEIEKRVNNIKYYDIQQFAKDCKRYAKAVKECRLIVSIVSVSKSGMSRTIKVREFAKANDGTHCLNGFYSFFKAMGEALNKDGNIVIKGCGTDAIFSMNYTIINRLHRLGVINKTECANLISAYINRM